jgi:hypothetical protein
MFDGRPNNRTEEFFATACGLKTEILSSFPAFKSAGKQPEVHSEIEFVSALDSE